MPETVLVTGGSGYVAGWCLVQLLQRGYVVRATLRSLAKQQAVRDSVAAAGVATDRLTFVAADLTADAGWDTAMAGCDYVLHVASPLGIEDPTNPDDLIIPAREGTLRVLRAATQANVKRVVMTSSNAAASQPLNIKSGVSDETLWTNPDDPTLTTYRKSKTLSELAAWQFMRERASATTLTTILPGAILGPVLSKDNLGSVQVVSRLLQGRLPGNPRLGFEVVDVRDVADMHLCAMTSAHAAGERFSAVGEFMWLADIARMLRARLPESSAKVPTRALPDFVLRLAARFDPSLRTVLPMLGRTYRHSADKATRLLDWHARPAGETVVDCAESLIRLNAI